MGNNGQNIVSYPSLSNSLHTLPNVTSMSNIPLHANMYGKYAQESQAKLQKAIASKNTGSYPPQNMQPAQYAPASSSNCDSNPLMMRKPQKSK